MSGYVRGKIECYISNKDQNYNAQNAFKNLYDFFTSHSQYTLVALQYGATNGPASAGAGTGIGYADSVGQAGTPAVASFGNNAWFVVRANATLTRPFDVYHYFQWCGANGGTRGSTPNTSPGTPSLFNGSNASGGGGSTSNAGIAYQCVIGISGSGGTSGSLGGNPWKGTTNANGADTKPAAATGPVWGAPAGGGTGVMIFPRSNDGPNGTHQSASSVNTNNCQNCGIIINGPNSTLDWRMHIVADDDSWVLICDTQDNNTSVVSCYSGLYIPRNGLPLVGLQSTITPYVVVMAGTNVLPWSLTNQSIYGDAVGTSSQQGGVIGNTTGSVRSLVMDQFGAFQNDYNFQPCIQTSSSYGGNGTLPGGVGGAFFDEFQIPLGIFETSPTQISGYLGEIDFVRHMYNVQQPGVRWDFNRAWFSGSTTIAANKLSIPWDSQNRTVPRTGITRQGISFIRPGPA